MRIYQDGNLPDVQVEWQVPLLLPPSIDGADPPPIATLQIQIDGAIAGEAPLADAGLRIADVTRDIHDVRAFALDASRTEVAGTPVMTVDVRDGNSRSAQLFEFLTTTGIVNVAWQLPDTCEALGADHLTFWFERDDGTAIGDQSPCDDARTSDQEWVDTGVYRVRAEAQTADGAVVATSQRIEHVAVPSFGDAITLEPFVLRR